MTTAMKKSTWHILDDCISALFLHHDKSIPIVNLSSTRDGNTVNSGIDEHAVESHDANSTAQVTKQKDEDVHDILIVAARNRIKRVKARSKYKPIVSVSQTRNNNDEAERSSRNQEVGAKKDSEWRTRL